MADLAPTNSNVPATGVKGISQFLNQDNLKSKFAEVLGARANAFVSSMLAAVSQNELLKNADQNSIYLAGMVAASLDLMVNPNIGHAFLIPYGVKQADGKYKQFCQLQISAKGFRQLAMRSGQFKRIAEAIVYEGQIISEDPLMGFEFDWKAKTSEKVIGYVSRFELINGFESTFYMTVDEVRKHGARYSKTFNNGVWKTDFDKMALKTVTKLNLSKNAPLSSEMQRATLADQAVIKNYNHGSDEEALEVETVEYPDNDQSTYLDPELVGDAKQRERTIEHIENAKTLAELEQCSKAIEPEDFDLIVMYSDKEKELKAKK